MYMYFECTFNYAYCIHVHVHVCVHVHVHVCVRACALQPISKETKHMNTTCTTSKTHEHIFIATMYRYMHMYMHNQLVNRHYTK